MRGEQPGTDLATINQKLEVSHQGKACGHAYLQERAANVRKTAWRVDIHTIALVGFRSPPSKLNLVQQVQGSCCVPTEPHTTG